MKYLSWLLLAASPVLLGSCKKLSNLTKFNVTYTTESTIQAGVATFLPFDVMTPSVTTESSSEFEGHNTAKNLIQSVKLNRLQLTITSPDGRTFDFLKNIEIYISSEGNEEVLLAQKDNIPDTQGAQLELDAGSAELKKYIMSDAFSLRLKVTTDKVINQDIKIKIASTFKIDANVLGL